MGDRKLVTTKDVVEFFGCGMDTVAKYRSLGILKHSEKIGNQNLYDESYLIRVKDIIDRLKAENKTLQQIKEEIDRQEATKTDSGGVRVLVIEDDEGCINIFKHCLEKASEASDIPLRIFSAKDGLTGVEYTKKLEPHIVILDLGLPKQLGLDVYAELKNHPSARNTEFILTSGVIKIPEDIKLKYIPKPFNLSELIDWVRELLKRWQRPVEI